MPETGHRTPDPRGQEQPRVASAPIPPADPRPNGKHALAHAAGEPEGPAGQPGEPAGPAVPGGALPAPAAAGAAATDAARTDTPAAEAPGGELAAGPAHAPASPRRRRKADAQAGRNPLVPWLKEIGTIVVVALVLSFLIKTFLFRAFYIPSESMVATLDVNDRILVNLLVPEPLALERGDIVVFRDTKGWLAPAVERPAGPLTGVHEALMFIGLLPDDSEQHLVKRVIGLPGDRVVCCDAASRITVNGAPLEEKYLNAAEEPQVREFDVVVPAGKVWVMGDNRNHSADSRAHLDSGGGFVDVADIEGKAAVVAWPVNRISVLDNHPEVFVNVPAPGGR